LAVTAIDRLSAAFLGDDQEADVRIGDKCARLRRRRLPDQQRQPRRVDRWGFEYVADRTL
jgi:hypothetical protein